MARSKPAMLSALVAALALAALWPASARAASPSAAESFSIGTSGAMCEAQGVAMGAARQSVFERKWMILCRDIARPVGTAYALRGGEEAARRTEGGRAEPLACTDAGSVAIDSAGSVRTARCRGTTTGLEWIVYSRSAGGTQYVVEGLAAYDSALRLALANLVADRVVPGKVEVVNLGTGDTTALVQARAAVSDVDTVIGQGYRGNSAGSYTEAAELFAAAPALLADEDQVDAAGRMTRLHESKVNRALQLSNLGAFDQAARLFGEAREMAARDPVQARLVRNFEAIDAINRGELGAVAAILDRPMPPIAVPLAEPGDAIRIDPTTAAGINASSGQALAAALGQETRLTPAERALIIDAQAVQLRGTVLRLQNQPAAARAPLARAYSDAIKVRDGRVVSITRLRSQILSEMALTYEAEGRMGEAEGLLRQAQSLVESQYPDSASVNAARARLAGFLARRGRKAEALAGYRTIVETVAGNRDALVGMTNLMRPYFDLLTEDGAASPQAMNDLFLASQLVERPGAADTMAQLARQLEGGSAEASALYRQSLALSRALERNRLQLAQADAVAEAGGTAEGLGDLRQQQQRLGDAQLQLMTALAAFPQYRAVANRTVGLDELRASLAPGEAYLKLAELGGSVYAVYVSPTAARGWKVAKSAAQVAELVQTLRDSISSEINGERTTYPFDLDAALALHEALLGPVAADLGAVRHLVFEPDGAMLKLPLNLLTGDRAAVEAYRQRIARPGSDDFDFTGIAWLGRSTAVSTALSAVSFRDARQAPQSRAANAYLGLGQNAPLGPVSSLPSIRAAASGVTDPGCDWPAAAWNQPISAAELREASAILGPSRADLMTGAAFTDTAIKARADLASFRIVHFATHGLVTPPREGCPARPALLTSFGGPQSDGLLGFGEIFNLQLDADLVILSACDTAAKAGFEATREAGVTSGGEQALDGLVRAFIAAGGRQVIASHWPAPEDYGATRRLIAGLFSAGDSSLGDALMQSQRALMDDARTSHPFYWAGFALIGDGARKLPGR